jgi:hypothetical protein
MDNEPTLTIDEHGNKRWRLDGDLHRVDGPAVEYADGDKEWYLNDEYHRVDGPAVEWSFGDDQWWLNDERYDFDKWLAANIYISEEEKLMLKLQYG